MRSTRTPGSTRRRRLFALGAAPLLAVGLLAACSSPESSDSGATSGNSEGSVVVYSGRSEELVGPLIDRLNSGGQDLTVDYDRTAIQILEEGDASPADVFFAQDAGELGRLADADLLEPLPDDIVELVDPTYRIEDNAWAPVTARSRVLAYNPDAFNGDDLPPGIDGLLDPRFNGKIGYAPTNPSFKSFVTALRVIRGEDGARQWLEAFIANNPVKFARNGEILEAVNNGTVGAGLINHYYWAQQVMEEGLDNVPARLHFFSDGDPGALVNVSGAAVLKSATNKDAAFAFIRSLLSDDSQRYFAEETGEYPINLAVPIDVPDLPPLQDLQPPDINLDDLADVDGTERLLQEVGAV